MDGRSRRWGVLAAASVAWLLSAAPANAHAGADHASAPGDAGWAGGIGLLILLAAVAVIARWRAGRQDRRSPGETERAAGDADPGAPLVNRRPMPPRRPAPRRTTARPPAPL